MSKISIQNLKLSAVLELEKFMNFSHYYGLYNNAEKKLVAYKSGNASFEIAEMMHPEEELQEMYTTSVHRAINKLFVLDRAFFKREGAHIVAKLDNFEDYVEVLEAIQVFVASNGR